MVEKDAQGSHELDSGRGFETWGQRERKAPSLRFEQAPDARDSQALTQYARANGRRCQTLCRRRRRRRPHLRTKASGRWQAPPPLGVKGGSAASLAISHTVEHWCEQAGASRGHRGTRVGCEAGRAIMRSGAVHARAGVGSQGAVVLSRGGRNAEERIEVLARAHSVLAPGRVCSLVSLRREVSLSCRPKSVRWGARPM